MSRARLWLRLLVEPHRRTADDPTMTDAKIRVRLMVFWVLAGLFAVLLIAGYGRA